MTPRDPIPMSPTKKKTKRRSASRAGCLLFLLVLAAAGAAGYYAWDGFYQPYQAFSGPEHEVVVEPGTGAGAILYRLEDEGVLADARLARAYLVYVMGDPHLKAGQYRFEGASTGPEVLAKLVKGESRDLPITLVEGLTLEETADALVKAGFGDRDAFLAEMRSPARIADLDPEARDLEGYLFPDTYRIAPAADEAAIVDQMVGNFRQRWEKEIVPMLRERRAQGAPERAAGAGSPAEAEEGETSAEEMWARGGGVAGRDGRAGTKEGVGKEEASKADGGAETPDLLGDAEEIAAPAAAPAAEEAAFLSPREVVILASIVEKEARLAEERPVIASVYRNRLDRGIGLYADPTVIYALKKAGRWDGDIRRRDLQMDSPYNTYRYRGLPPGPIASPGLASLIAAARPADSAYLYFVSRNDGSHVFSETLAEHNRNVERWQKRYWRENRGGDAGKEEAGGSGEGKR